METTLTSTRETERETEYSSYPVSEPEYSSAPDIDIDYGDDDDDGGTGAEQPIAGRYAELNFRVRTAFPNKEARQQNKDLASIVDITLNNAFVLKNTALAVKKNKDVNNASALVWELLPPKQNGSRYNSYLFDYNVATQLTELAAEAQERMIKRYAAQTQSFVGDEQPDISLDDEHMTVYSPDYETFSKSDPPELQISIRLANSSSKIAAFADVTFNGVITVCGFRVVHRQTDSGADGGYWLAMPSTRADNTAVNEDICYPVTSDFRSQLENEVISAYTQELENYLDHLEWLKTVTGLGR